MKFLRPALLAAVASVLVSGCASVPKLGPKPALRDSSAVAAPRTLEPAATATDWPSDRWWTDYDDPQLTALITEGLRDAPDVAAAAARFRRAAALAQQAGAARLPTVDASGQVTLEKQSLNNGIPPEFVPQGWNDSGRVAASFNYELDLWGKNRAAFAAATSEQRAAALDVRQGELLVSSGIATAYFDLAALYAQRDVRAAESNLRAHSAKLMAERFAHGLENRGSVAEAEAQVAQARSAVDEVDQTIAVRRHQLAELAGAGPDRGLDIARPALPESEHALPVGVTTALLGRRPDVVAARERTEAAAARIKVARADFFPAVNLSALVGLQSLGLANLLSGNSLFGSVGPAVTLPIFHGGALQGRYRQASAEYDAAVADYNKLVLTSYREVADAVTNRQQLVARLAEARRGLASAEEADAIARRRYKGGLINYLDVLTVADRLLQVRLAVAQLTAALSSNDIDLIRALGGGLSTDPIPKVTNNG